MRRSSTCIGAFSPLVAVRFEFDASSSLYKQGDQAHVARYPLSLAHISVPTDQLPLVMYKGLVPTFGICLGGRNGMDDPFPPAARNHMSMLPRLRDAWAKHKDLDPYEAKWLYVDALLKV